MYAERRARKDRFLENIILIKKRGFIPVYVVVPLCLVRSTSMNPDLDGRVFGLRLEKTQSIIYLIYPMGCEGLRLSVTTVIRIWGMFSRMGPNPAVCATA